MNPISHVVVRCFSKYVEKKFISNTMNARHKHLQVKDNFMTPGDDLVTHFISKNYKKKNLEKPVLDAFPFN